MSNKYQGVGPDQSQCNTYSSFSLGGDMSQYTLGTSTGDYGPEAPYVNVIRPDGRQYTHYEGTYDELPPMRPLQAQGMQTLQLQGQPLGQQSQLGVSYLQDSAGPKSSRGRDDDNDDDYDHDSDPDGGDEDGGSRGSRRPRIKKPHLQGRFSGRLATKEDERRLAEECKLLGPLLGGVGKRGDKSRLTLAKIVRGIATGDIRRYCEERERLIQTLKNRLASVDPNGNTTQLDLVRQENAVLRADLAAKDEVLQELTDKGLIAGFVPSVLPSNTTVMMSDSRYAPYTINVRRDRPMAQYLPMPAGRPPQAVLSADFMRREHSAPTVTYSDGGSMSMASRAGRPSLPKKIALMAGANSEPASMQPQISSQTGVQQAVALQQQLEIQQQLANLQAQVEQLQNLQNTGAITLPINNTVLAGSLNQAGLQFQTGQRFAVHLASQNDGEDVKQDGSGQLGVNVGVSGSDGLLRAMAPLDLRVAQQAAAQNALAARNALAGNLRFGDGGNVETVPDENETWRV